MKRREFLASGVAAGIAGTFPIFGKRAYAANGAPPVGVRSDPPFGRARNVIFFAYDGFGFEDIAVARYFAARRLGRETLNIERLMSLGAFGMSATHSLSSIVTDSAAASSAWSTGQKLVNRYVSMHADGRPLTTVLEIARGTGRATGLVTSTRLTHATPAGWVAKVDNRELEDEIALQYLEFAPDVLLGGGSRHFDPGARADDRDLFAEFRAKGYQVLGAAGELESSTGSRLLGAFTRDHLPYEIDRVHGDVAGPSLAQITRRGLEVLAGADRGFVLQIEAGRIDHANHQNDPGGMVWDVIAADDALAVAMDFVDRTPETVLILASDHATGGGAVFGTGSWYNGSDPAFDTLGLRRSSQERFLGRLGGEPSADQVRELSAELMGVTLSPGDAERLIVALQERNALAHPVAHGGDRTHNLHFLLTTHNSDGAPRLNVNFATGAHTAGPVPLAVYGAGVTAKSLGMVDNTDLFHWVTAAIGADYTNPPPSGEAEEVAASTAPAAAPA